MKSKSLPMMNRLGTGHIITIFVYWFFSYIVTPSIMPFAVHGLWEDLDALAWIDMVCYVLNGIVVALIMKDHLSEHFFDVHLFPAPYIQTVSTAVMMMLVWVVGISVIAELLFGGLLLMFDFIPLSELGLTMTPALLSQAHPVLGTLCLTCFVPFTVCGFFYATGFAPLCCHKPWLAYLNVCVVLLISSGFEIMWYKDILYAIIGYILRIPIHLIACWSYQKTDNIWTPIFSIGLLNLASSLLFIFLSAIM